MEPVKNVILPPYQLKPVICNKHCVAADTNLLQTYGAYKSGGALASEWIKYFTRI